MSSPVYDLTLQGITQFSRWGRVLSQRKISRDPLHGVVDGSNKIFHTNYYPLLTSGSLLVYDGVNSIAGSADFDTGEIALASVPTNPPTATYAFTPYTADQVLQFLVLGFDELELRWNRNWKLVTATGAEADESSSNILVADKDGNEPTCGAVTFSTSRTQVALFMLCAEYRYYLSQTGEAAISSFAWRESARGMMVDKTKVPGNLGEVLNSINARLLQALRIAQEQFYPGGENYGGYVSGPNTADYIYNYFWQDDSKLLNIRGQGLNIPYRNFGY